MSSIGKVQTWAIPVINEQLDKLNKRAAKCGVEPLKLNVLRTYIQVVGKDALGSDKTVEFADVEIVGICPKINGWQLVAKISPLDGTDGNLIKAVPGVELNPAYRTISTTRCDHCQAARQRKDVFVLRHTDGREQVIGRNCLADFIRSVDFEAMIEYADVVNELIESLSEERDTWGPGSPASSSILHYLETTSICVRKLGWLSRSKARDTFGNEQSTADLVNYLHWAKNINGAKDQLINRYGLQATGHDKDLAEKALAWVRESTDSGDYMHNLRLACSRDWVTYDTSGIVASLIPAYNRHMEQETKRRELRKAVALREFIGKPGERLRGMKLTCIGMSSHESMYGVKTFLRFLDESENLIVWSASGDKTEDFINGHQYIVDATIKEHVSHEQFGRQNFVSRVTIKAILGEKAAA